MNNAEDLTFCLRMNLPGVEISVDAPPDETGRWFMDVVRGTRWAVVEWLPGDWMGVSLSPTVGFGEKPDAVFPHDNVGRHAVVSAVTGHLRTAAEESGDRVHRAEGFTATTLSATAGVGPSPTREGWVEVASLEAMREEWSRREGHHLYNRVD